MEKKTNNLLEKYVHNSITSEEGRELKKTVVKMSNEELAQALADVWENYDAPVIMPDDVSRFMKDLKPKSNARQPRLLYTILKVAAAILIPILLGTQIYFYLDNKKLNRLLNGQLTV